MQKFSSKCSFVLLNMKLEGCCILIFIIGIVLEYIKNPIMIKFATTLPVYFDIDRISGIASFFSITVGMYIAVITIFAVSIIGISREILKDNLDSQIVAVIIMGIVEGLLAVGLSVFLQFSDFIYYWFLSTVISMAIISFAKFIYLLMIIFKKNLDMMSINIDKDEKYKEDLLTHIEIVSDYCTKNKR